MAAHIAYILEFGYGAPIENISAQITAELLELEIEKRKKRRRRKREEETQELLLVNGYIGIINGSVLAGVLLLVKVASPSWF